MRLRVVAALRLDALSLRVARALAGIDAPATRFTSSVLPSSIPTATLFSSEAAGMTTRFSLSSAFKLVRRSRRVALVATRLTPLVARSTATPTTLWARSVPRCRPFT